MQSNSDTWNLAAFTAAVVTTATFAKTFVPFYLIGSTAIFALTCGLGIVLVALSWRQISDNAKRVTDILVVVGLFYVVVIVSYLSSSFPLVPVTHLLGILIFHALFMIFGFAAARVLKAVLFMLLGAAAIYLAVIAQYTVRFGDLMRDGYLHDVFGVGEPAVFVTFHQNIGEVLGLAALAALGLGSNRIRQILAIGALPLVLLFMYHIAARGALVGLVCSLIFWAGAGLWVRSKKLALIGIIAAIVAVTLASDLFYQRALQDKGVDAVAPDAISRTIREIQNPDPGFRMQIWARAWQSIAADPDRLLFGRGIGIFPVNEGFGAPDWLLHKTEGARHYPHNMDLELLYETGIVGLLLFSILTILPIGISLRRWRSFSPTEKSTVSLYVFYLVSSKLSAAFAFSYDFQFFFALTVGLVSLKRTDDAVVASPPPPERGLDPRQPLQVSFLSAHSANVRDGLQYF
jgi:O-antigen ligase